MYRIYNIKKKKWIKNNIFLSPDPYDDLYALKKNRFGKEKLVPISDNNYVVHKEIGLYDMDDNLIYEGDYVQAKVAENRTVIGLVTYAHELAAYIILCTGSEEYFTLGQEVCEFIQVIGNVFDGYDEEEQDGQQSLQESEVQ